MNNAQEKPDITFWGALLLAALVPSVLWGIHLFGFPAIIIPALSVAFAAFCVWLTVRIIKRRERWTICVAIALIVISATLAILWLSRPRQGILFDTIESPPVISGQ
jgi:O-antigen/teichoic acid export membrane protein